jgi:hypothetical protein
MALIMAIPNFVPRLKRDQFSPADFRKQHPVNQSPISRAHGQLLPDLPSYPSMGASLWLFGFDARSRSAVNAQQLFHSSHRRWSLLAADCLQTRGDETSSNKGIATPGKNRQVTVVPASR